MFRGLTLFWCFFLVVAAGSIAWSLTQVNPSDRDSIPALTDRMPLPDTKRSHTGVYRQRRQNVRRDLWIPKDGTRLQTVQRSTSATLAANQREHALLEELSDVLCHVQESVDAIQQKQQVAVLTANCATYDYSEMHLQAQPVAIEQHVLTGTQLPDQIDGKTAVAVGQAQRADFQNALHLQGAVTVQTTEGLTLACDSAKLDRERGYGQFEALTDGAYTVVQGQWRAIPLLLRARRVELWMATSQTISECVAEGAASLGYGSDWKASGDRILYYRQTPTGKTQPNSLDGIFHLVADHPKGCLVQHVAGSRIAADQMTLNSETRELTLYHAEGRLCGEPGNLDFQADKAFWNHLRNCLTLIDHVVITQGERHLRTLGNVCIVFDSLAEGVRVSHLDCVGPTEMVMGDRGEKLSCHGVTRVDFRQQRMTLSSPADRQLSYCGSQGELTSDRLTVDYVMVAGDVTPKQLTAEGHVCLARQNHAGGVQYALADVLDYAPESGSMRFRARAPRRVIFFDHQYDLKVSAPEVQITRDDATGQEKIRGVGDLRMTLLDQELAQLRKRFVGYTGDKKS
jgi:hypothetical protein